VYHVQNFTLEFDMVRKNREDVSHVISIVLAGGAGKRLFPLTQNRSKPAVPLGGKYRLIDIPLSNCINSGLKRMFVLTQYNSASLNHHVTSAYHFDRFNEGFVEVLAAEQTMHNPDWFQGTADAVRQHLHRFTGREDDYQLILAGDQLYRMNYHSLLEDHWHRNADVTVCVIPKSEDQASSMGLLKLDANGKISEFREKPTGEALQDMRTDTTRFGLSPEQARQRPYLASMGIYLFRRSVLKDLLADPSSLDFGHQVIPRAIAQTNTYGHLFDGYWEDLGTVEAFYKANIDLTSSAPHFDFHDMSAPIYTRARFLPPSRFENCDIREAIIAEGSLLKGASITSSIVGIRSVVREGVVLDHALIMGADFYEDDDDEAYNRHQGIPDAGIGKGSVLRKAIVDKNAHIGANVRLVNEAGIANYDGNGYFIRDGIVIVPKNGIVPDGTVV
jgi:glucose-1-phosphate adenylyltransferase